MNLRSNPPEFWGGEICNGVHLPIQIRHVQMNIADLTPQNLRGGRSATGANFSLVPGSKAEKGHLRRYSFDCLRSLVFKKTKVFQKGRVPLWGQVWTGRDPQRVCY